MLDTVTAPTIWGLYVQGIKDLGIRFVKVMESLYMEATIEQQYAILDMLTYTRAPKNSNSNSFDMCTWGERTVSSRTHCPPALTLTMKALREREPLTPTSNQKKYFKSQEYLEALQHEVEQQNTWVKNNTYAFNMYFTDHNITNQETLQGVNPPNLEDFYYVTDTFRALITITQINPKYAPLAVYWAQKGVPIYNVTLNQLPGLVELRHQQNLWYFTPRFLDTIMLLNCSPKMIEKTYHGEPLTNQEYRMLADKLEELHPIQELAYQNILKGTTYENLRHLESHYVNGHDVFLKITGFEREVTIPDATKLWLLQKMRDTNNTTMELDNMCSF